MVDMAALGRTGAPFAMDIEPGKVREFAVATRSANAAYLTEAEPVIPPTFLTTASFWSGGESDPRRRDPWDELRMDQSRALHAEQEYVFHGPPPRAGTRLTVVSRIAEIYSKQGRRGGTLTFAVMVTEFRDSSGRLVCEARQTGVETSGLGDRS